MSLALWQRLRRGVPDFNEYQIVAVIPGYHHAGYDGVEC
jgi:hypothetical protein